METLIELSQRPVTNFVVGLSLLKQPGYEFEDKIKRDYLFGDEFWAAR